MKQKILIILFFLTLTARAQEKHNSDKRFQGLYGGASFGVQNIFGGAYIDDLDVLAQKSGLVFEVLGGYRLQLFNARLVLGVEYLYGITYGDLNIKDPRYFFAVNYENDHQIGLSLNLGYTLGKNRDYLVYVMFGQGKRNFDISFFDQNEIIYYQKDQQNFDRLGLGFETKIIHKISARLHASKVFTDYGELKVSQNVEDKLDFNLALIFQL